MKYHTEVLPRQKVMVRFHIWPGTYLLKNVAVD